MSLCLYALGGALLASAPGGAWELRWTHSVARTEWREVWRAAPGAGLVLDEARVKGAGAGMEPGPDARLIGGWWTWRPAMGPLPALILAASDFSDEHTLCAGDDCRLLSAWAGGGGQPVELRVCQ